MRYFRNLAVIAAAMLISACQKSSTDSMASTASTGPEAFTVSGIRVIHKMVSANDVVAARLYIDGGSAALTAKTAGIEPLYLALMVRGTEKYDRDAFAAASTASGTSIGSDVTRGYSSATMQAVRDHLDEAWDLFTQAVLHPTLSQSELELVRPQLVFALKQRIDDPDAHLTLLSDSVFFAGHPYAIDPDGTPESMAALTLDDLRGWQKARLTKANLLLVVVGNVTRADLEKRIAESFGTLPAGTRDSTPVPPPPTMAPSLTMVTAALPTNYIQGVFAGPARADADFPAFALTTRILGERLFEEVRTKRNLTYAVNASMVGGRVTQGQLYVTAVAPDTTIKVMMGEVKRIQNELVPADFMQEVLNEFVTSYWLNQETNMSQAAQLGNWELTGGGWENAVHYADRLKAVTAADVQRVAKAYLNNFHFVVIGNPAKVSKALFTASSF